MAKKLQPQALQDATSDLAAAAQHLRPLIRNKGADSGEVATRFNVIVRAVRTIEAELAAARKRSGSSTVPSVAETPPEEIVSLSDHMTKTRNATG